MLRVVSKIRITSRLKELNSQLTRFQPGSIQHEIVKARINELETISSIK